MTDDVLDAIRDSAAAIAPRGGGLARIRALRFTQPGFDPAVWRQMGEFGWIGLRIPEDHGGSGLGLREQGPLLEELGRALVPEPLAQGALSAAALLAADDVALLPTLLAGNAFAPLAWQEEADTLHAAATQDGARRFIPLPSGGSTALFFVQDGDGTALHAAAFDPAEVLALQDGGCCASWTPSTSQARRIGSISVAAIDRALEDAAVATSFYLLGVAEQAFDMTLGYLRVREQFGRKLGSFQALQHRAADLKIALALTRASVEAAAASLDAGAEGPARSAAVARAKARAGTTALLVTRTAVQLHGAIGYTDEYDIGLYLRKAMVVANQFGSARLHRRRFSRTVTAR